MASLLVLVPTDGERRVLAPAITSTLDATARVELCGFGPVAAAARTAALVARHTPDRVVLVGIAGRLDERLAIGSAHAFREVACFGIGAGSGASFEPAAALGWPQWPGDPVGVEAGIGDVIDCGPADAAASSAAGLLVTACAASASEAEVADRLRLFPAAVAEDMEGYGVALACRLAGVPLAIVRGISNTAGDRNKRRWHIADALEAAAALAGTILASAGREPSP
jgi:futalosine hydrolase